MSQLVWPTSSTIGASTNFTGKYGSDNVSQLAVQFFDYIRCVNLYDGILARNNNGTAATGATIYDRRDSAKNASYTFTNQRMSPRPTQMVTDTNSALAKDLADDTSVMPGHGQVTPAIWEKTPGGTKYRGFGRMFTLSEIGLQFICTADGKNDGYSLNFGGKPSGGGSAVRTDPTTDTKGKSSGLTIKKAYPYMVNDLNGNNPARWFSNFPPLTGGHLTGSPLLYGTSSDPTKDNHVSKHPGYWPENWNYTLEKNTELTEFQKRIQAIFLMETFCPSLGWTKFYPEYTIVLPGAYLSQIKVNGKPLFPPSTGPVPVKSDGNLYEASDVHSVGGHAGPTAMAGGRGGRSVNGEGTASLGSDPEPTYWTSNPGKGHTALKNYGLTSDFITVNRDQPMTLDFPDGALRIEIYDTHNYEDAKPIQIVNVRLKNDKVSMKVPVPHLVGAPDVDPSDGKVKDFGGRSVPNHYTFTDSQGRVSYFRSYQAPHFWCYNYRGCIGIATGEPNQNWSGSGSMWTQTPRFFLPTETNTPDRQATRGRLDTGAAAVGFTPPGGAQGVSMTDGYSDVTRTFVPAVGDYRMIAARYEVPDTMWLPHPNWIEPGENSEKIRSIHSFTGMWGHTESGARLGIDKDEVSRSLPSPAPIKRGLVLAAGVQYSKVSATDNRDSVSRIPDLPGSQDWARAANSYGDFDNGIANSRDGPYINKPDEGNFYAGVVSDRWVSGSKVYYRSGYFYESWRNNDDWRSGIYMTPNRLVSSPVMFGSLPTGVWGGPTAGGTTAANSAISGLSTLATLPCRPWQTLLFRPHMRTVASPTVGTRPNHPGESNPRDHYLLDMFFMPVVEPYAISEPLSVAGRVNLNYQIMPFTYIRRATALHALMKGEFMTAIPNEDVEKAKRFKESTKENWDVFYNDKLDGKFWHRPIDVTRTLRQFDEKFSNDGNVSSVNRGLFRTASQICELYLIPEDKNGPLIRNVSPSNLSASNRKDAMNNFWDDHSATGDNVRERPYSNLYSRVTTRSNTFRVHVRAQAIKKARSVDPGTFDPARDTVLSEYRGSTLIERYIDPTDTSVALQDYGASQTPLTLPPLDTYYQFRTLETKRFNP
jgi:uncharacterized protein (TIGR02600 family)